MGHLRTPLATQQNGYPPPQHQRYEGRQHQEPTKEKQTKDTTENRKNKSARRSEVPSGAIRAAVTNHPVGESRGWSKRKESRLPSAASRGANHHAANLDGRHCLHAKLPKEHQLAVRVSAAAGWPPASGCSPAEWVSFQGLMQRHEWLTSRAFTQKQSIWLTVI